MYYKAKKRKGYTIIELVIYGGLLGILLVILSEFFVSIMDLQLKTGATSVIDQDSEYIFARSSYDVRRTTSIELPLVGQSGATLSAVIHEDGVDKNYRFDVQNGNLMLTVDTLTTQLNSSQSAVLDFVVTRIGNSASIPGAKDTIQMSFTMQSKAIANSGVSERPFVTTISLR